jgi:hypothetical protein
LITLNVNGGFETGSKRKCQVWNPFKKSPKKKANYDTRFQTSRIAECLNLIGHANPRVQIDILRRLSRAISLIINELGLPDDATFAQLKRSLRSEQASAVGMKVRELGAIAANYKADNRDLVAVDEMIFMLIGASLSARSRSREISPEHEQSIDRMIAIAEEVNLRAPGD